MLEMGRWKQDTGFIRKSCLLHQLCVSGRAEQGSEPEYLRTWECPENSPEICLRIKQGACAVIVFFNPVLVVSLLV